MERGQVNLNECENGDLLISALGAELIYIRPTTKDEYLDHVVEHLDRDLGTNLSTRTNDGYLFQYARVPESDHDIIEIIKRVI